MKRMGVQEEQIGYERSAGSAVGRRLPRVEDERRAEAGRQRRQSGKWGVRRIQKGPPP